MIGTVRALALGILVAFVLFIGLGMLILEPNEFASNAIKAAPFDFVRVKKETPLEEKSRIRPPKPKPTPKMLSQPIAQTNTPKLEAPKLMQTPALKLPSNFKSNITASTFSGSANMEVVPLVRVPPMYPKRALRMKKEGFVTMRFTIDAQGLVLDIAVIEAEPPGMFEDAAMNALKKWKFKPKIVNGKAVIQQGEQTINFTLGVKE